MAFTLKHAVKGGRVFNWGGGGLAYDPTKAATLQALPGPNPQGADLLGFLEHALRRADEPEPALRSGSDLWFSSACSVRVCVSA